MSSTETIPAKLARLTCHGGPFRARRDHARATRWRCRCLSSPLIVARGYVALRSTDDQNVCSQPGSPNATWRSERADRSLLRSVGGSAVSGGACSIVAARGRVGLPAGAVNFFRGSCALRMKREISKTYSAAAFTCAIVAGIAVAIGSRTLFGNNLRKRGLMGGYRLVERFHETDPMRGLVIPGRHRRWRARNPSPPPVVMDSGFAG
jgi:hypothetical protein